MKKQLLFMTVLMAFLATSLNSCKKDNQKDAPLLPPQSSFIMDMSDFNNELKIDNHYLHKLPLGSYKCRCLEYYSYGKSCDTGCLVCGSFQS